MTRRNDKRNNNSEVSPFAQMILGAILSKGAGMIANALMDKAGERERAAKGHSTRRNPKGWQPCRVFCYRQE